MLRLPLPESDSILSIVRDGPSHAPDALGRLAVGDDVLVMTPSDAIPQLDRIFGARKPGTRSETAMTFRFAATAPLGSVAEMYEFWIPPEWAEISVGQLFRETGYRPVRPGRRIRLTAVDLTVSKVEEGRVAEVALDLEPEGVDLWRRLHLPWLMAKRRAILLLRRRKKKRG